MRVFSALCVGVCFIVGASVAVQFTGDAYKDFNNAAINSATGKPHNFGVARVADAPAGKETACSGDPCPDVGIPTSFCVGNVCPLPGWDIRNIFFQYDSNADTLKVGIDCFGVCGDADGDGFEGVTSPKLSAAGGADFPDLSRSEGFGIALDFNLDVMSVVDPNVPLPFDFVVGVPSSMAPGVVLPCTSGVQVNSSSYLSMTKCFGLYNYAPSLSGPVTDRFLSPVTDGKGAVWKVTVSNTALTASKPDIEFEISSISELAVLAGADGLAQSKKNPWTLVVKAFAGSFDDDGVGEDFVPNGNNDWIDVHFPCLNYDACDVCNGDGTSCHDCAGVANGASKYDACDICGGNGKQCADCRGVPNGPAQYDSCGVCNGNNKACADCAGVPNGNTRYDACDVCGGNSRSCLDCAGIANGPARYDSCDVCGGDHRSCMDCARVPNGAAKYDACDVCNGNGLSCRDCLGVVNGPHSYDQCDVCNGNGLSCVDCAGVPNGPNKHDVCGVCGGNSDTCDDCMGVPKGGHVYDECGVCGGDSTSCMDCNDVPNGPAKFDNCGVCGGDGSSCVCLKIYSTPTAEVDHALLEWTIIATMDRINHTVDVLEGIKEELGRYDVKRGNLAHDISSYLDMANEFRDVVDNFCYIQVWFKESLDDALQLL